MLLRNDRLPCLRSGLLILLFLLLCSISEGVGATLEERRKIEVVASIFPLTDLVRQVGGDWVEVRTLLPPGANPHTFEPTPRQVREFSRARLFVRIGAGLELWAEKLLTAREVKPFVVTASEGVPLLRGTEGHDEHDPKERRGDPHVWLDPVLMRERVVPRIADHLARLAPQQAAYFRARRDRYLLALQELDREIRQQAARWSRRRFMVFHSSWRYFARQYGVEEVVALLESPNKEPSARWVAGMVDMAREYRIKVIFAEPQSNPRPAQVIAQELGGKVLMLDPLGGESVPGRDNYIDLMRYNARSLEEALR